jgi:hypothetical protein
VKQNSTRSRITRARPHHRLDLEDRRATDLEKRRLKRSSASGAVSVSGRRAFRRAGLTERRRRRVRATHRAEQGVPWAVRLTVLVGGARASSTPVGGVRPRPGPPARRARRARVSPELHATDNVADHPREAMGRALRRALTSAPRVASRPSMIDCAAARTDRSVSRIWTIHATGGSTLNNPERCRYG